MPVEGLFPAVDETLTIEPALLSRIFGKTAWIERT